MAMWSPKRWSAEAIAARKAAEAGTPLPVPAPPPLPPPPPLPLHPVEEKWMAQLDSKRFYFTAKGLKEADDKAASFFRVIRYTCEVTCLGPISC
jgi:hypothetical protein